MILNTSLFEKLEKAYQENLPFVAFKTPLNKIITAYFQKDATLHTVSDFTEKGFVFAPFEDKEEMVLLIPDEKIESEIIEDNTVLDPFFEEERESFTTKERHVKLVKKTVSEIENTGISKIVVARTKTITRDDFDFIEVFKKLLVSYPSANVYVWYHPKVGMWLGATPEKLLEVSGTVFNTMSLAGTQKFNGTTEVVWGEKELEEQQMVTDSILSNLKPFVEKIEASKVETVKAGALLHLCTHIKGTIAEEQGLKSLVTALHPTPAVCGLPKKEAKKFILANESFDRRYYTGFLGELNMGDKTRLYVNLRCMEVVSKENVKLYIGGGITQKSIPEKEWSETVSKSKTMERVL